MAQLVTQTIPSQPWRIPAKHGPRFAPSPISWAWHQAKISFWNVALQAICFQIVDVIIFIWPYCFQMCCSTAKGPMPRSLRVQRWSHPLATQGHTQDSKSLSQLRSWSCWSFANFAIWEEHRSIELPNIQWTAPEQGPRTTAQPRSTVDEPASKKVPPDSAVACYGHKPLDIFLKPQEIPHRYPKQ